MINEQCSMHVCTLVQDLFGYDYVYFYAIEATWPLNGETVGARMSLDEEHDINYHWV